MDPSTRANTVSLFRAAIAVALCTLAIVSPVRSEEVPKYTVLAMEYFGSLDKPIEPIVISNSSDGAKWYRNTVLQKLDKWHLVNWHVVSRKLLEELIATVESDKGGVQQEPDQRSGQYNGVSVTIITKRERRNFLFHVEQAMPLLDRLGNLCKSDRSLVSHLLLFKGQISFWGDNPPPRPGSQDHL